MLNDKPSNQRNNSLIAQRMRKLWQHGDRLWRAVLVAMALLVLGLVVAVGMMLWQESTAAREALVWNFYSPPQM